MRVSDTKQNLQSFYKGHIYRKQSSIRTDTHIYVIHSDGRWVRAQAHPFLGLGLEILRRAHAMLVLRFSSTF